MIGRLLHDTGSLPAAKAEELEAISRKRGVPLEWSFLLDALQSERDQAVTIDTTRVWFTWNGLRYMIIDAPGHREFIRNMLTGSAEADAAVIVVDVMGRIGEQTRRHARLLQLLGIRQIVIAVNKMDMVDYGNEPFLSVSAECENLLHSVGLRSVTSVPVCARTGENVATSSEHMPWYGGQPLVDVLAQFAVIESGVSGPFRMRVQDVYRRDRGTRVAVGRIESGRVSVGDRVVVLPMNSAATVQSVERWNAPAHEYAAAGDSIGLTFHEPIFVDRGDLIAPYDSAPSLQHELLCTSFWLDDEPPAVDEQLVVQFGPTTARVIVTSIEGVTDSVSLATLPATEIPRYAIVQLRLRSPALIPIDDPTGIPGSSRLVLLRGRDAVAGGIVTSVSSKGASEAYSASHLVSAMEREQRYGHRGAVIWLTGLSGAGKSTLAMHLERKLFVDGATVYVLDGDNVRRGLSSDLGFSSADRSENIRRVGELAALFADSGMIVIAALISPMQRDRNVARAAAGDRFHEIYVRADIATCEARDTKGLYKRARSGDLSDFTGVSAPYEAPDSPDLVIDTTSDEVGECVERLFTYVAEATGIRTAPHTQPVL